VQNILKKEPLMLTLSEVLSFLCGKVGSYHKGQWPISAQNGPNRFTLKYCTKFVFLPNPDHRFALDEIRIAFPACRRKMTGNDGHFNNFPEGTFFSFPKRM
jgi:hypothetical protein